MAVHASAIIDPGASVDEAAEIGPFCVVGTGVRIGARTRLMGHNFLEGDLTVGEDNIFFPFSSVGVSPQDLKYKGEKSRTEIGHRNRIREFVTIHRGTEGGGMVTAIGNDNLLMAYVHVAHDVRIGNHSVLANGVTLAGHVIIGDWAVIGGLSAVHQFCRIGRHSIVGGGSIVTQDVAPFSMTVAPRESRLFGENKTGLERRGFPAETIQGLHRAFRHLTAKTLNTTQAIEKIRQEITGIPEVDEMLAFVEESQRGIIK
jgi:UDP-N-acetylglucosamine acyltransferase